MARLKAIASFMAHPFTPFAKGWSIALCATTFLYTAPSARAQSAPCGLTSMRETKALNYPPIMKAAHVQGVVVLLAAFDRDGKVTQIKPISGPGNFKGAFGMLRDAATEFVQGWQANPYSGPRECPIAINFIISKEAETPQTTITRIDLQHVQIIVETYPPTVSYTAMASK